MGKYVNENLIKDEKVIYETRLSRGAYLNPLGWIFLGLPAYIQIKTSEFAITNKRVIIKTGWLSRRTLEMNLNKIESVKVEQGVFNVGSITIIGTGGTKEKFSLIKNPTEFRKKIQELIE